MINYLLPKLASGLEDPEDKAFDKFKLVDAIVEGLF